MTVIFNLSYQDLVAFDSAQRLLPEQKREKGFKPWLYHRWLNSIKLYGKKGMILEVANRTQHLVPKMMFFLLPIFALFLKLFYNRRKYFYADHVIFALHYHTAVFLIFLVFAIISLIFPVLLKDAETVEILLALIYLGLALRKTYGQSASVTFFKVVGLTLIYSVFILMGYVIISLGAFL